MTRNQVVRAGKRIAAPVFRISSPFHRSAMLSVLMLAAFGLGGCAGLVSGTTSNPPSSTLTISNVQNTSTTTSASQIVWTTNVAADSVVNYGTTLTYGFSTPVNSVMVTNHQVVLSGLAPDTTYYYEVASTDSKGNHGKSGGHSFQTLGFSISGTITPIAGGSGATLTLTGAANSTTTSDTSGNYTFTGLSNGPYTISPSHSGFTFTPSSQSTTINGANVTGVNFTDTAASSAPTITTQPANQTVTVGQAATFAVVATGTAPLSFQWSKNGTAISGATSSTYTTPATTSSDSGAQFAVIVSNGAGSLTSAIATLTVTAAAVAPTITTQPANQTVTVGQAATFTLLAAGTAPLGYQWQKNGANIAGASSASYTMAATTTSDSGAKFDVVVSNSAGTVTSTTVTLTVNAAAVAPTITTQPVNQAVTLGQTASFSVVATGTAPLSYRWQKNGSNISGATSSSYTTAATTTSDSGSTFSVVVSNSAGSITSNVVTLTVNPAPAQLAATPFSATFPSVVIGTSNSQTITLTNGGGSTITISQATVSGTRFSITGLPVPATLAAGTSSTFNVLFAPTTAGSVTGSVSLVSDAPGSPLVISLNGTGVAATLLLGANPNSLSFGNVNVGSSSSQSVVLTNNGNSNVTSSGATVTGSGFSVSGVASGTVLGPNQTATLNVVFAPTAAGSVTGSVSMASNATNSPTTITLAGTGQQATSTGQWITGFFSAGNTVLPISDIPWSKYTHINHFAAAPGVDSSGNGNGTVELHYLTTTEISQIVSAAHAAGKKIIVTIKDNDSHLGAFGQSTAPALLATFVSNIANFVNSNGYDGVDFDWEQQIDVARYENLLSSVKASFGGSKLILTDMGNWNNMPTIAAASYSNIDQINLMCYDMEKQTYSWHNDALFQNGDTTKMTCDWRVGAFTAAGVPKAKIGIGIPFYGYSWSGCSQPLVNGCTLGTYATYSAIVTNSTWYAGGANHAWDSTFSGDYLSVSSSNMFITYNDTTSIQAIVNWQKAQGFGGFMTFTVDYEYLSGQTGDARYPLSTALCQEAFGSCP